MDATCTAHERLSARLAIATRHASKSFERWTRGHVRLALDEVIAASLDQLSESVGVADGMATMVVLGVEGDPGGQIVLIFDDADALTLARKLTRQPMQDSASWTDLEESAIKETGNILASAYLSELSRIVDRRLTPSPPWFLRDFAASVVQQALMSQAMERDEVILCRTRFEVEEQEISGLVFCVPSSALVMELTAAETTERASAEEPTVVLENKS